MATSQARIETNRKNSAHSTGPKTTEGKERSRANALKHGLTSKVVLPEADAAEVERRTKTFAQETNATGDIGQTLARIAALNSVQFERAADQQTAALTDLIRQVEAEFVPPQGVGDEEADRLRDEACRRAMLDTSKEAILARKYQAAAERSFHRALKELRQMERKAQSGPRAIDAATEHAVLTSFFNRQGEMQELDDEYAEIYARLNIPLPKTPVKPQFQPSVAGAVDLPFAVGRRS